MTDGEGARLTDLSVGHGRLAVLTGVNLQFPRGAITALVGANGSGKTTLLRTLLGLLPPLAGQVQRAPGPVGYVPQIDRSVGLLPLTAEQVVSLGLCPGAPAWRGPSAADHAASRAALDRFGAAAFAERFYADLSGGQRQRVLLARAVVAGPVLLALDEPVRGLDLGSAARLLALLRSLARDDDMALVVATHSLDLVANHADQVALFHDGRVVAGSSHEMLRADRLEQVLGQRLALGSVGGQRVIVPKLGP